MSTIRYMCYLHQSKIKKKIETSKCWLKALLTSILCTCTHKTFSFFFSVAGRILWNFIFYHQCVKLLGLTDKILFLTYRLWGFYTELEFSLFSVLETNIRTNLEKCFHFSRLQGFNILSTSSFSLTFRNKCKTWYDWGR